MDTRRLESFIEAVDQGSVTRAAEKLCIAQPALSNKLSALENEVGVQLLVRSHRGVSASAAGEAFYRQAKIILDQWRQAQADIAGAAAAISGPVHVGMPRSIAGVFAPHLIEAVRARFPAVDLRIIEGLSGDLLTDLTVSGRLDLAFLPRIDGGEEIDADRLECDALYFEAFVYVAPRALAGAKKGRVTLQQIANEPLIMPGRSGQMRRALDAAFQKAGVAPKIIAELDSVHSIAIAVDEDIAAAFLPAAFVKRSRRVSHVYQVADAPLTLSTQAEAVRVLLLQEVPAFIAQGKWEGATLLDESARSHGWSA